MKLVADSSSFAKRYIQEGGSAEMDLILQRASDLALCIILVPEIISGLNRRLREGFFSKRDYRRAKT
jgi:predicted nucleic acid-binding protein